MSGTTVTFAQARERALNHILSIPIINRDDDVVTPIGITPGVRFTRNLITGRLPSPGVHLAELYLDVRANQKLNIVSNETIIFQFDEFMRTMNMLPPPNTEMTSQMLVYFYNLVSVFITTKIIIVTAQNSTIIESSDSVMANIAYDALAPVGLPASQPTSKTGTMQGGGDEVSALWSAGSFSINCSRVRHVQYHISHICCSSSSSCSCSSSSSSSYIAYMRI